MLARLNRIYFCTQGHPQSKRAALWQTVGMPLIPNGTPTHLKTQRCPEGAIWKKDQDLFSEFPEDRAALLNEWVAVPVQQCKPSLRVKPATQETLLNKCKVCTVPCAH